MSRNNQNLSWASALSLSHFIFNLQVLATLQYRRVPVSNIKYAQPYVEQCISPI